MNDLNETGPFQPGAVGETAATTPQYIGRYRVERVLGEGGFGIVYLAHDEQLQRRVAVKVPHRHLVQQPEEAQAYLSEARTVANLDHANIVPVHDVGSTEQFPCFVVSKYIDGPDLAHWLKHSRLSLHETVELVATVAEALHHAHRQGLVHRDIKPGNILLDKSGKPFVADFGLALREQDVGTGPRYAGTPAYMSPEQARGEGHRVDGRSDIFSLGVVFYLLLTGRMPFHADSREELLEQITSTEVRPPRQWDDTIPKELERICQKAMAKRASERYSTAKDLAEELRHFLAEHASTPPSNPEGKKSDSRSTPALAQPPSTSLAAGRSATPPATTPTSDHQPVKIVPKGLRSFDAHDADFFPELLPGPRDRDGLPDSIRFWKDRIEEKDSESTFAVGLLYGPSGCGKTSLVKAGLLPRLAKSVTVVYIEATAVETEARLLKSLRRQVPDLPATLGLIESLVALRQRRFNDAGQKVLLVLDQFEQWLHAKRNQENTELVQALRQCEGGRVQCLALVRDDFWMAATRFMRDLEIRLVEGQNSSAVDLFTIRHAEKVLAAFGRAFGALPESSSAASHEQIRFLQQAVSGLAQEGKVISVRLALFAEMMKGKSWTPASLKAVGGMEGVGVTFLEETFSAATAPPEHRYHQKAARAVLKALLPEAGTDIKGHLRSQQELREASGYASRPRDFDDLLRILDSEIRLLTPTDPEGKEDADPSTIQGGAKYYQLTHDYLVPSLRDWLTRKQKETRRGRVELLLADRAAVWNSRPENRQLPSLLQWLHIRWHTRKKSWTPPQRKMMSKATRFHAVRGLVAATVFLLIGYGIWEGYGTFAAYLLRDRLLRTNTPDVPPIVNDMTDFRRWTDPLLREAFREAEAKRDVRQQLNVSLALLPVDPSQNAFLFDRLLDAAPIEIPAIRDALLPFKEELVDKLWTAVEHPPKGEEDQRLRAACALASYDPSSQRWDKSSTQIVKDLVAENPLSLGQWSELLRPVKTYLVGPLADVFRDRNPERATEGSLATSLLADYAADDPRVLADLLMDAGEKQFAVIYPKLKEHGEKSAMLLTSEIAKKLPPDLPSSDKQRETLAKRQANAAVALLRMNQAEKVWPLLRRSDQPDDPRLRSYLLHRLAPLGTDAAVIVKRLDEDPDVTIRRALVLSLGEYSEHELSPEPRKSLLPKLQALYRSEADPGLHGAVEWLLRQWQEEPWLKEVNDEWAKDKDQRDKRLSNSEQSIRREKAPPQWYVNSQSQTMVVIPGPVQFLMGSPSGEKGQQAFESQHMRRIGRTFALATKPVTVQEFRRFLKANKLETWFEEGGQFASVIKRFSPAENGPIIHVNWYLAALYCNWLSAQEGIPEEQWCYETNMQRLLCEKASAMVMLLLQRHPLVKAGISSYFLVDRPPEVTALRKNYLSLVGYRLPTQAEWEYACRAGAVTSRYYGETEELLARFGWYVMNSGTRAWPVGSKKPNDLGLFDMHGNVFTWCQGLRAADPKGKNGEIIEDKEEIYSTNIPQIGVTRGGSFYHSAPFVRSAARMGFLQSARNDDFGFRVARTYR